MRLRRKPQRKDPVQPQELVELGRHAVLPPLHLFVFHLLDTTEFLDDALTHREFIRAQVLLSNLSCRNSEKSTIKSLATLCKVSGITSATICKILTCDLGRHGWLRVLHTLRALVVRWQLGLVQP